MGSERPPLPELPDGESRIQPQLAKPQLAKPQVSKPQLPARRRSAREADLTQKQRDVSQAEIAAFATMEAEMGGRDRLVAALSSVQLSKGLEQTLGMIADPVNDHEPLARICVLTGIGLQGLMEVFKSATLARSQMLAVSRVAEKLPDVAAAVMDDAVAGKRLCPGCLGAKQIELEETDQDGLPKRKLCGTCKGMGEIWHTPDHEVQKTALKLGRLLDTGKHAAGGVNVQVLQQNTQNNAGDTGNYDQLMSGLDDLIYGQGRERIRGSQREQTEFTEGESVVDSPSTASPNEEPPPAGAGPDVRF